MDANQTVQVMLNEIARLQTELTSPDEITAVAQQFLTTYYMGQETNAAQTGELAEYELIGGGWRNAGDVLERLRAVTPEDVRRVANIYMRNMQFIVLGNPRSIDKAVFTKTHEVRPIRRISPAHFGCGTIRIYGRGDFQPCG